MAAVMAWIIIYGVLAAFWAVSFSALEAGTDFSMGVYFGAVMALFMTLVALLSGVAWAPIGAAICASVAWRRGLSPIRHAAAGAARSAMLILPWVYFLTRMLGVSIPKSISALEHACMQALWFGAIPLLISLWIVHDTVPVISNMYFISALLSSVALAVSVKTTLRAVMMNEQIEPMMSGLPNRTLAMQFVHFLIWSAIHWLLFIAPFIDDRTKEITLGNSVVAGVAVSVEAAVLAWMVIVYRGLKR